MAQGFASWVWLARCELPLGWYVESACLGFTRRTPPSWQLSLISLNCVQVITPWIKPGLLPTDSGYKGGRARWWVVGWGGYGRSRWQVDPWEVDPVSCREWHLRPALLAVSEQNLVWQPLLQADCNSKSMIAVRWSISSGKTLVVAKQEFCTPINCRKFRTPTT